MLYVEKNECLKAPIFFLFLSPIFFSQVKYDVLVGVVVKYVVLSMAAFVEGSGGLLPPGFSIGHCNS